MKVNKDLFLIMRAGSRPKTVCKWSEMAIPAIFAVIMGICLLLIASCAMASTEPIKYSIKNVSYDDICTAIGKAENSKVHPYGIMTKYKHTTPKQACINTIRHNYKNYVLEGQPGNDFIHYLSLRYAPIGVANDPHGLNANWERNVKHFLNKG